MDLKPGLISNLNSETQDFEFLNPVNIDKPPYDEEWLQKLVHNHPDLIPASEIEACFNTLVPLLMEYSLPSGYLDNFMITPDGYPVLVEVKLWKNQESRRKVVAQILEYSKDFSSLTYDDLNSEFIKKNPLAKGQDNPIYSAVSEYSPDTIDEITFVNRVSRNLKEGRFLLIILGDGIREELASLSEYLIHHSLRYAFGLVQVKIFEISDNKLVALPTLMGKTQTIERHVTVVNSLGEVVSDKIKGHSTVVNERTEKSSLSTDEFYNQLSGVLPGAVAWLKRLIERLSDIPVELAAGKDYASLLAPLPNGENLILAKINLRNSIEFWGVPNKKRKNPLWSELSRKYLTSLADLAGDAFVKEFDSGHMDVYDQQTGKLLSLDRFIVHIDPLDIVIRQVVNDASKFFDE